MDHQNITNFRTTLSSNRSWDKPTFTWMCFFFRLKGDINHYHYANLGDWKMWISVCVVLLLINHLLLTNAGYWGEYDYIWYSIKLRTGYD